MSNKNIVIFVAILTVLVFAGAVVLITSKPSPQLPVTQPPVETLPKEEEIDTSDWKTYRNEKYGFEVRYLEETQIWEVPSGVDDQISGVDFFFPNNGITIRIAPWRNTRKDQTLEELFETREGIGMPLPAKIVDFQEISISGKRALKKINYIPSGERIGADVVILGTDYYYTIETGNQYTPAFDADKERVFDVLVSTFKLLK